MNRAAGNKTERRRETLHYGDRNDQRQVTACRCRPDAGERIDWH